MCWTPPQYIVALDLTQISVIVNRYPCYDPRRSPTQFHRQDNYAGGFLAVYVDEVKTYSISQIKSPDARAAGNRWCHMTADTLEELHAMADSIGLKRSWFQPHHQVELAHYDITPAKRVLAIRNGAIEVKSREHARQIATKILEQKTIE